ncbi:hypothetical protein E4U51_005567 [Claviceps purpurea]|nr:hypothetical protein E4U51_005567 [Claviceps purpurea]
MAEWHDLTGDDPMQSQLEDDGESTQRNGNGNAHADTSETQPPSASPSANSSKAARINWDLRKTRVFLEALVTALNDGARYRTSNKAVARAELLATVLPRMQEDFPTSSWTVVSLTTKFKSLESDMRKALTLITKSGNHYDDATGVIETTDEQWEEFERKYGDKARAIRNKGIPWVESLMKQVWPDARPTGDGIDGARSWKRPREEVASGADTPETAPPSTPDARGAITPGGEQSSVPKRRHRRLDQLMPYSSHPTSFENGLRLFSVSQNAGSLGRAIEICVKDFGEELGAAGRQAVGAYFVEHPEFLAVFLAYPTDDRRVFLVSKGLMEEADED